MRIVFLSLGWRRLQSLARLVDNAANRIDHQVWAIELDVGRLFFVITARWRGALILCICCQASSAGSDQVFGKVGLGTCREHDQGDVAE